VESSFHLFLHCPFALALWNCINITFNVTDLSSPTSLILGCGAFNAQFITHSSLMHSHTKPRSADITILLRLDVTPSYPRPVSLTPVLWKAPMALWTKVNSDESVIDTTTACGAILRDCTGAYKGGFSSKLAHSTVLHAELMGIILAMEMVLEKGWSRLWVEIDSQLAIRASRDHSIVPWNLQNRWHNCFSCQMQLLFSHVYREGNACADKVAAHSHVITGFLW
jgi:ribonuclease HI